MDRTVPAFLFVIVLFGALTSMVYVASMVAASLASEVGSPADSRASPPWAAPGQTVIAPSRTG